MRVETDEFRVGQRAIFNLAFTVNNGPASPTTVTMNALQPDGTVAAVTLAGAADTRTGSFDPAQPGWHVWRCVATGNGVKDAEEGRFFVHPATPGLG